LPPPLSRRRATSSAQWLVLPLAVLAAAAAGWLLGPHVGESARLFPLAVAGGAGLAALVTALVLVDPAWILSGGLALSMFSGNWSYMHVPGPLDRVVILSGIAAVVIRSWVVPDAPPIQVRRLHWLLALLILYAVGSAAWANTLHQHAALFELLDRLGAVPFLLYLVAPAAFATHRQRTILLGTLVAVGAYLGVTAIFEVVGPHQLVFPSYINNPSLGIHADRARGPFLEAGADGLAMFTGLVASAMLLAQTRSRRLRSMLAGVIVLCLLGIVLCLTRQVWAGAAVGSVAALSLSAQLRKYLPLLVAGVAILVAAAVLLIPGLNTKVSGRASAEKPVWDRLNSDSAALRMIESRPLLGFGWGEFPTVSFRYYHVARTYPLSAVAEVHNVVLSNAAEIGVVGVAMWLSAVAIAMTAPFRRRGPPSLEPWKLGMVAVAIAWFVQANFAPLSYAFDNYVPWLFAGIALGLLPEAAEVGEEPRSVDAASWAAHSV